MTKQEAIEAMKRGEKVTHDQFNPEEWITIEDGEMTSDEGMLYKLDSFFEFRRSSIWDDGWSIWEDKTN